MPCAGFLPATVLTAGRRGVFNRSTATFIAFSLHFMFTPHRLSGGKSVNKNHSHVKNMINLPSAPYLECSYYKGAAHYYSLFISFLNPALEIVLYTHYSIRPETILETDTLQKSLH